MSRPRRSRLPTTPLHMTWPQRWRLAMGLLGACMLALPPGASAQTFKDAGFQALYVADQYAELDKQAQQRLQQRPDDAQAVLATALVALQGNDGARREAAIRQAEACVQKTPNAAPCQFALGSVLGVHAMSKGMMAIAGSVGRAKEALLQAMQLEPQWYPARSAVVEYYLEVPGLLGGSSSKATETARGAATQDQVRALEARIALNGEQFEQALKLLAEIKPAADPAVVEDARQWTVSAAFGLLNKGQADAARTVFLRLQQQHPDRAIPPYGLARVALETGAPADAIALLTRAAGLKDAERLPIDYRLGLAQQAQGQAELARASFQRYLKSANAQGKSAEDAKKRLAQLGS